MKTMRQFGFEGTISLKEIRGNPYQNYPDSNFRLGYIYIDRETKTWFGYPRDGIGLEWVEPFFVVFGLNFSEYIFDDVLK
jgi:hypothetical protein